MILLTENGAFFGTEWDDKPIRPENFRRVKEEKTENKSSDKEIDPQNSTINRESSEEPTEEVKSEEEHVFGETKSEEEMQNPLMKDDHNCREMHDPETASEEKIQRNQQKTRFVNHGWSFSGISPLLNNPNEPSVRQTNCWTTRAGPRRTGKCLVNYVCVKNKHC